VYAAFVAVVPESPIAVLGQVRPVYLRDVLGGTSPNRCRFKGLLNDLEGLAEAMPVSPDRQWLRAATSRFPCVFAVLICNRRYIVAFLQGLEMPRDSLGVRCS